MPKNKQAIREPEQFVRYLKNHCDQFLQVIPVIKYDLDGVKIKLAKLTLPVPGGVQIIEGSVSLSGDLIVKPNLKLNNMTLSVNDLKRFNVNAQLARDRFLQTLKVSGYMDKQPQSL